MKISKLLVLTALWLGVVSSAKAEVPDGVWTMPEPTGLEVVANPAFDGTHYVLYNPAAKLFFASGNDWNTRASVATFGYEVWFTGTEESGNPSEPRVAPEGSYFFNDDCQHPDRQLGNKDLFTDGGGATWVDRDPNNAGQTDFYWSVTKVGDYYRIQNTLFAAKEGNDGKFIGWKSGSDTRLYMITPEEGAVDWQFVTVKSYLDFTYDEAYEAYQAAGNTYFSGVALGASLKAAEELGINIAQWLEVYKNTSSTKEELDAAKTAVDAVVSAKNTLQKLVDAGAELNAPIEEAQALLANADATADELKAASDKLNPIIEVRTTLKKALEEAKAAGFTETASYDAIYNEKTSNEAQLKKALEDLNAALVAWGEGHATWEKPADFTGKITNPNFDNASYTGWLGTAPNMVGSGSHGPANVAEKWNDTFDTYQNIIGLPAGVYALGAQTMWRGSWNDMQNNIGPAAFLYATAGGIEMKTPFNYAYGPLNTVSMAGDTPWGVGAGEQSYTDEETGTTYYIPNDPSCFRLYAEKGLYDTKVLFVVNEGDTLRIGVKNPAKLGDADNWTCFDTFTLAFYGNAAEACQAYVNEAMKNFNAYEIEDGTLYTAAYLDAYQKAYTGDKTASSMADVKAIIGGINKAKEDLDKNIELWQDYQKVIKKAQDIVIDPEYENIEETYDLSDYIMEDYEGIIKDVALTNEQLESEIAKLNAWMKTIDDKSKQEVWNDKDMTKYIKNPGFDEDKDINSGKAEGWTIDAGTGGNITRGPLGESNKNMMESILGEMNYCFEAWHRYGWDVWQEIENLPVGMYELQVQGYVRCEVGGYNRGDDIEPDYPSPVYLYMNNAMSQFPSVYSECPADLGKEFTTVESWTTEEVNNNLYPNSMGGAAQCFGWGMYKTTAYGLIAKEGDKFRIGVKYNKATNEDWWCIWDSFKLTYKDPTPDIVKPQLEAEVAKIDLSEPMGKDVFANASAAKAKADEALKGTDGKEMFAALADVYDAMASIRTSVALFKTLIDAVDDLGEAAAAGKNPEAMREATALCSEIRSKVESHEYADAEVQGLLDQMAVLMTKVKLPADITTASDDNPIDVTDVIKSASFEDEDGNNSSAGWTNPGNLGNDDTQKSALAMEFWQIAFDMFQTIKGLPEGTYELTVDAWVRSGSNEENYAAWTADPTNSMALLYAVDGDSAVYTAPIINMMAAGDALLEEQGFDGETTFTVEETTYYVPGSLLGGKSVIEYNPGVYTNKAIVKVKADETLTIGIKKAKELTNSWVVLDDFKLFYLGKDSKQEPSKDLTGIASATNGLKMKVEYFMLDGRKATAAQKGIMIQKMTLENGDVLVKKIRK